MMRYLFCFLLLSFEAPAISADTPEYDVVIRDGRVLDGAGNPWFPADIAIKEDLSTINDTATWLDPTQKPTGIDYVLVNGQLVLNAGRRTGATPGQVLRGPGYNLLQSEN